jgi:hypothetical protein
MTLRSLNAQILMNVQWFRDYALVEPVKTLMVDSNAPVLLDTLFLRVGKDVLNQQHMMCATDLLSLVCASNHPLSKCLSMTVVAVTLAGPSGTVLLVLPGEM